MFICFNVKNMKPEKLIENFSAHLKNIIARSISMASSLNYDSVSPVHILHTITEETGSIAGEILYRTHLEPKNILKFLELNAPKTPPKTPLKPPTSLVFPVLLNPTPCA